MKKPFFLFAFFLSICGVSQNQYAWLEKSHIPAPGRHGSLGLAIANRGYIGLGHVASPGLVVYKDWWEYDPGTDTWMQRADFGGQGRDYACGFGLGNYGYVGTGQDTSVNIHDDWWRYDPSTNTWTYMGVVPGGLRDAAVAFAINGKGYVGPDIFLNELWEYDPGSNSWTQRSSFPGGTAYVGCATTLNGKAYFGLTYYWNDNDWWQYDPVSDQWTQKTSMPGLYRSGAMCFTIGSTIYCGTGTDWNGMDFADMYTYNSTLNTWTAVNDFPGTPRHLLAGFTLNDRAYFGTGTNGTNYNDFWEFGSLSGFNESTVNERSQVYPNPVRNDATIIISEKNICNAILTIRDANGKIMSVDNRIEGNSFRFDRGTLSSGNYIFVITEKGVVIGSGKFIVQ